MKSFDEMDESMAYDDPSMAQFDGIITYKGNEYAIALYQVESGYVILVSRYNVKVTYGEVDEEPYEGRKILPGWCGSWENNQIKSFEKPWPKWLEILVSKKIIDMFAHKDDLVQ